MLFISLLFLQACNLEREVNIELPDYKNQPVVECYLEAGKPYRLLLSQSFAYFDQFDFDNPAAALINDAIVIVRYKDQEVILNNQIFLDLETGKVANYGSTTLIPEDFNEDFFLEISLKDGTLLSAQTKLLPVVPIDSVIVEFNPSGTKARALTYFTENQNQINWYRRMLNFGSLDSIPLQDFVLDDDFFDTSLGVFGSGFGFEEGDTLIHTLVHIKEPYYKYLNTLNQSISANINPFGQPGLIESNIMGTKPAIGIFTGLSLHRDTVIISK
jgi:hypothetical protein